MGLGWIKEKGSNVESVGARLRDRLKSNFFHLLACSSYAVSGLPISSSLKQGASITYVIDLFREF